MKAWWSWKSFLLGGLAGLVLLGGIGGGIAIKVAVDDARQQAYTDCLAEHGYYPNDSTVDTYEELEQLIADTEDC